MNHILLVDDLSDALAMLQDAVRAAFGPVPCTLARSVHEALQVIDSGTPFDLVLIDLALGDGSGLELIERLAQRQPRCAVVVASIHDDDDHLFQALQAGAQGYLLKDHPTDWLASSCKALPRASLHFRRPLPAACCATSSHQPRRRCHRHPQPRT